MELFQKSGKAFPVFVEGVDVACSCSGCTDLLYSLAFTRAMVRLQEVQSQCQGPVFWRCPMTVTTSLPSQWPISFLLPGFWSGNKCYVMWPGHSTTAHQGYSWEPWTHWTCVLLKTSGTHNLWAFYNNQLGHHHPQNYIFWDGHHCQKRLTVILMDGLLAMLCHVLKSVTCHYYKLVTLTACYGS